jgi:hypothetical protein
VTIPITRPIQGIRQGEWNEIEPLLDANILRAFLNDGGGQASVATEEMSGYGPIALYVGKDSEVRFKDIAYKDLALKKDSPEEVGKGFRMQRLSIDSVINRCGHAHRRRSCQGHGGEWGLAHAGFYQPH